MFIILGVILWVLIAFWPATIAKRKGHSFILFFVLSLFFFFLSLILALMVKDRTKTPQEIADEKAVDKVLEEEQKKV